jgi:hypothetical protein
MDGPRKPCANRFIEEITFRFFVTYEAMGAVFFDVPLVLLRTDTTDPRLIGKIVEFAHDATESYYERGKYGCISFHATKHLPIC